MGDKVCRMKTFYEKPADGPWYAYKREVCEDKEPEQKCWYEKKLTGQLVKQLGGTMAVLIKSILVRKCEPAQ